MKPATRQKIIEAMQRCFEEMFFGSATRGLPQAERQLYEAVATQLEGKVDHDVLSRVYKSAAMRAVFVDMETKLKDEREPTPEQLDKILKQLEGSDIRSLMRGHLKWALRKLRPASPGKAPALDARKRQEALAKVAGLIKTGLSRKEAYKRVGSEYGLHWRTIQNLSRKARNQVAYETRS